MINIKSDLRSCGMFVFRAFFLDFNGDQEDKRFFIDKNDIMNSIIKPHFHFSEIIDYQCTEFGCILYEETGYFNEKNVISYLFDEIKNENGISNFKVSLLVYAPIEDKAIRFNIFKEKQKISFQEKEEDAKEIIASLFSCEDILNRKISDISELDHVALNAISKKLFPDTILGIKTTEEKLSFF